MTKFLATLALLMVCTLPAMSWDFHPKHREGLTRDSRLNREINHDRNRARERRRENEFRDKRQGSQVSWR